jgi:hypothetical protein
LGVQDDLAAVVKAFPEAKVVAFADLSSRMILASQGREDLTQEFLDQLCLQARASFDDPLLALSVEAFGEPNAALVLGAGEVRVFLRSDSEPADAMCCICAPGVDLPGFIAQVKETLAGVSGG